MKVYMYAEEVPIESVIPYTLNSKIHTQEQIDRIANSINLFGFNQPIIVDGENVIICGHGRYEACKKLGRATVPVIKKTDLTPAQIKAYRIIDNKTSSDTGYVIENLRLEVKALEEMGYNVEPFHFEEFKLEMEEPYKEPESKEPEQSTGNWVGEIMLKVPAEEIDTFEDDLKQLLNSYPTIQKEVKRTK